MKILITGATGLIGSHLAKQLLELSHSLTLLTHTPNKARTQFGSTVNYCSSLDELHSLDDFDAVINLAGEPIAGKRWSKMQKELLCRSRWQITAQLAALFVASKTPPSVLISGSAVGYYGDQRQRVVTEDTAPHDEFTHKLCRQWEALALQAQSRHTRVCLLRTGIVLSPKGGALARMLPLFRLGLGGAMGNGHQYLPWIHIDDMVNGIIYLLDHPTLYGPFNMTAPNPVCNEQFTATLANTLNRLAFFRIPGFIIRLLMGEAAVLVLNGQQAIPKKLQKAGFHFHFVELEHALNDVLNKKNSVTR